MTTDSTNGKLRWKKKIHLFYTCHDKLFSCSRGDRLLLIIAKRTSGNEGMHTNVPMLRSSKASKYRITFPGVECNLSKTNRLKNKFSCPQRCNREMLLKIFSAKAIFVFKEDKSKMKMQEIQQCWVWRFWNCMLQFSRRILRVHGVQACVFPILFWLQFIVHILHNILSYISLQSLEFTLNASWWHQLYIRSRHWLQIESIPWLFVLSCEQEWL